MHAILLHDSLAVFEVIIKLELKVPFPLPQHSPLVKHENYAHHYGYCAEGEVGPFLVSYASGTCAVNSYECTMVCGALSEMTV